MAYVKLDTGVLDSTLWTDRSGRELFITALLMAMPHEITEPEPELEVRSLNPTGWCVPVGWYGRVPAAGVGIARRAGMDASEGLDALERLASPDPESRTQDFEGRRLVRVDGGYIVLNFMKYRDRDTTAAERQQRYRDRNKNKGSDAVTSKRNAVTGRNVTQRHAVVSSKQEAVSSKQELPVGFAECWDAYPTRAGGNPRKAALKAYSARLASGASPEDLLAGTERYARFCEATGKTGTEYVKQGATFFGPDGHWAEPWNIPATPTVSRGASSQRESNLAALQSYLNNSSDA